MVKIEFSEDKGLVQSAGSGINYKNQTVRGISQRVIKGTGSAKRIQLSADDSHSFCIWGGSDATHFTLPAIQEGLRFTFFALTTHAHKLLGGASKMQGSVIHNANGTTITRQAVSDDTSITLHSSNSAVSDYIEVWCDGTNWYVEARTNDAATIA